MSEIYVLRWRKDDLPFWQDVDNDNRIGLYKVAEILTEHAALKRENDELRGKAQAVVDGATGGGFDKFSGFDDYIIPYRLVDELADALLTAEEPEDE